HGGCAGDRLCRPSAGRAQQALPIQCGAVGGLERAGGRAGDDRLHGFAGGRAAAAQDSCGALSALSAASRTERNKQNNREDLMLNVLSAVAAVAVGIALVASSTQAAEILVLGSQGNISGIRDLAAGFERASGHKVTASQERNVMDKVNTGAPADVVSGNPPVIDDLIKQGKVVGRRVDFARAGIGVAVKEG